MKFGTCLNERALYRRELHRASERGGAKFEKFLRSQEYLFAPEDWTRLLRMLARYGASKLAHFTDHKFRSYRGSAHDPTIDNEGEYPTIIETIITPHAFIKHVLLQTGA